MTELIRVFYKMISLIRLSFYDYETYLCSLKHLLGFFLGVTDKDVADLIWDQ